MAAPTSGASTTKNQIHVTWTAFSGPLDNGNSAITSYVLYWDQGTSTYVELLGDASDYLGTSYIKSTGITTGTTYSFKVKARNQWGDGLFSSVVSIVAASAPS